MTRTSLIAAGLAGAAALATAGDGPSPPQTRDLSQTSRALTKTITIDAPRATVWSAWSSSAGIKRALGVESKVALDLGGAYEWYFLPDTPKYQGKRGGEGNTILSYLPEHMISFTWNAPPTFPKLRSQRTFVVVTLEAIGKAQTRVTLTHLGWGTGGRWDGVYAYFDKAWTNVLAAHKQNLDQKG